MSGCSDNILFVRAFCPCSLHCYQIENVSGCSDNILFVRAFCPCGLHCYQIENVCLVALTIFYLFGHFATVVSTATRLKMCDCCADSILFVRAICPCGLHCYQIENVCMVALTIFYLFGPFAPVVSTATRLKMCVWLL